MTDSTRTDPRFHPAYQRGYEGQEAPSSELAPAEERFRRPRGGDAAEGRRRSTEEAARIRVQRPSPARVPERSLTPGAPPQPRDSAVLEPDGERAPVEDVETPSVPAVPRRPSALDRRVPIALAALGVLFVLAGAGMVWSAASAVYDDVGTEYEQFVRAITNYFPGPAITIGLLSIGAAITVRAARS